MEPLGRGSQLYTVISNEEQRSPLPSSKDTIRCSSLVSEDYIFSEETMQGLRELGLVLQSIHNRLISEGYIYRNGVLINPHEHTGTQQHT